MTPYNPSPDDSELEFQEDGVQYTFRELLDMLANTPDIMMCLPTDQVPELRAGLVATKGRDQQKLAKAGIAADKLMLSFLVYPAKDDDGQLIEGHSTVRVRLAERKGVTIRSIKLPEDKL